MNKQEKLVLIEEVKTVIQRLSKEQAEKFSELCVLFEIDESSDIGDSLFDYVYNDFGDVDEIVDNEIPCL